MLDDASDGRVVRSPIVQGDELGVGHNHLEMVGGRGFECHIDGAETVDANPRIGEHQGCVEVAYLLVGGVVSQVRRRAIDPDGKGTDRGDRRSGGGPFSESDDGGCGHYRHDCHSLQVDYQGASPGLDVAKYRSPGACQTSVTTLYSGRANRRNGPSLPPSLRGSTSKHNGARRVLRSAPRPPAVVPAHCCARNAGESPAGKPPTHRSGRNRPICRGWPVGPRSGPLAYPVKAMLREKTPVSAGGSPARTSAACRCRRCPARCC